MENSFQCGVLGEEGVRQKRRASFTLEKSRQWPVLSTFTLSASPVGLTHVQGLIEEEHSYKQNEYLISFLWRRQVTGRDWYQLGLPSFLSPTFLPGRSWPPGQVRARGCS